MSLRFQSLITRKGVQLGPMLLLNMNRKPYRKSNGTVSLNASDLEKLKSGLLRFRGCVPGIGVALCHVTSKN